jgi:hypothetical protein
MFYGESESLAKLIDKLLERPTRIGKACFQAIAGVLPKQGGWNDGKILSQLVRRGVSVSHLSVACECDNLLDMFAQKLGLGM